MPRPERRVYELPYAELGVLGDYLLDCRDRGMRPRTILTKLQVLQRMAALMGVPLDQAAEADVGRWWRRLAARSLSNNTRAVYLSHARAFYGWAVLARLVPDDPTRRLRPPIRRRGVPRGVDPGEVLLLLAHLQGKTRHMIALALWCGLRCDEIAQVRPSRDIVDRGDGRWVLHVHGKGGHARIVGIRADLAEDLRAAAGAGWLFANATGGHVDSDHVSKAGAEALRDGGIPATMHQLRHTHASALYQRSGGDLVLVGRQLGHRSLAATQVYADTAGRDPAVLEHLFDASPEA